MWLQVFSLIEYQHECMLVMEDVFISVIRVCVEFEELELLTTAWFISLFSYKLCARCGCKKQCSDFTIILRLKNWIIFFWMKETKVLVSILIWPDEDGKLQIFRFFNCQRYRGKRKHYFENSRSALEYNQVESSIYDMNYFNLIFELKLSGCIKIL